MPRPHVLCLWDVSFCPEVLDPLREVAEVTHLPPAPANLSAHIADTDIYLAALAVRLDEAALAQAKKLRLVATPSTGLDHLDLGAMEKRGIELLSIKTQFELLDRVTATAELAWALLLAAVRKIPAAAAAANRGQWARDAFRGHQLSGKTLGILGVGRLGAMVADFGRAFRMNVIGCDRSPRKIHPGVKYVDFDTLLRDSDVISIHIHATPENLKLINAAALAKMKKGVVLVNTSRGTLIDEPALLAALQAGQVGAAGLDVIDGEWRTDLADHDLIRYAREHDHVVIVPHLGGITFESQTMTSRFVVEKVVNWIRCH